MLASDCVLLFFVDVSHFSSDVKLAMLKSRAISQLFLNGFATSMFSDLAIYRDATVGFLLLNTFVCLDVLNLLLNC